MGFILNILLFLLKLHFPQALLRYDLISGAEVGVVSFTNVTRVEHEMARLDTETVREKVADTVPGKYQLAEHNEVRLHLI